jgi:hypothetical protein
MVLLLVLAGCKSCQPDIPYPQDERDRDSDPPPDTAGDTAPDSGGDSGPPARCDREEIEPNGLDAAEDLEMELWACGTFPVAFDQDAFRVRPVQSGWLKVQVEAALRGSPANPQINVTTESDSAVVGDGYLTTDPFLVFPASADETYTLVLAETEFLYGDDYDWYMLTSLTKEPVTWTMTEAEPNDGIEEAQVLPPGEIVFGGIASSSDFDWYRITTPHEGEQTLTFDVTAFKEGSAADLRLVLYDADGETVLREDSDGEVAYDRDPYFTKKITGQQDLWLFVRNESWTGSRFHWYSLAVTVSAE